MSKNSNQTDSSSSDSSPSFPAPPLSEHVSRPEGLIRPPARRGDFKISEFRFYIVCVLLISEAIGSSMLFSYVGLFVAHIEPRFTRSSAGYVAGLLVGCFHAVQIFALPVWGRLSDKLGRKPVMLAASILSVVASIAFGCSTSFVMAMCMRGLHGGVAGGVATVKTFIFEVTDEHSQARGFGLMNLMWALGAFVGPSVGGFLYDVNASPIFSRWLPHIELFDRYPALPPALAMSSYAFVACILAAIFIPESNPNTIPVSQLVREFFNSFRSLFVGRAYRSLQNNESGLDQAPTATEEKEDKKGDDIKDVEIVVISSLPVSHQTSLSSIVADPPPEKTDILIEALECKSVESNDKVCRESALPADAMDPIALQNKKIDEANAKLNALPVIGMIDILAHPLLGWITFMYMILCSFVIAYEEVFPLYAIAYKSDGGLGFTSTQVGMAGMINACVSVCANSFFSKISSRMPMVNLWSTCCGVVMLAFISIGFLSYLPNPTWCLVAFIPVCFVRTTACTWAFALNMMFTANAAPKRHLGLVTTISMSGASIVRSITPVLAAPIFAWSVAGGDTHWFPFNHFLLFLLCAALAFVCMSLSRKMPEALVSIRRS